MSNQVDNAIEDRIAAKGAQERRTTPEYSIYALSMSIGIAHTSRNKSRLQMSIVDVDALYFDLTGIQLRRPFNSTVSGGLGSLKSCLGSYQITCSDTIVNCRSRTRSTASSLHCYLNNTHIRTTTPVSHLPWLPRSNARQPMPSLPPMVLV